MTLVVLLRGVNVGGHRTFRPARLAEQLKRLGAVNIGAAGTFVIRHPVARATLRAELERRLPFETEIMICRGQEIVRLMAQDFFAGQRVRRDIVRFVSVLSRRPRAAPELPMSLPSHGKWLLKVLARDGRFLVGLVGHPEYYPRFGFAPASRHGLSCQWDQVPDEAFTLLILDQSVMRGVAGTVRYRDEFSQAT